MLLILYLQIRIPDAMIGCILIRCDLVKCFFILHSPSVDLNFNCIDLAVTLKELDIHV